MEMLWVISTVAVNCYIMISGYFLINRIEHRWKGIIKVWSEAVFYSFIIYLLIMHCTKILSGILL